MHFKKNKNDKYYIIDYSHEEIAQLIGSCRVTVTKILNSFQEKGMISLGYKKLKYRTKRIKKEYYHYFV